MSNPSAMDWSTVVKETNVWPEFLSRLQEESVGRKVLITTSALQHQKITREMYVVTSRRIMSVFGIEHAGKYWCDWADIAEHAKVYAMSEVFICTEVSVGDSLLDWIVRLHFPNQAQHPVRVVLQKVHCIFACDDACCKWVRYITKRQESRPNTYQQHLRITQRSTNNTMQPATTAAIL